MILSGGLEVAKRVECAVEDPWILKLVRARVPNIKPKSVFTIHRFKIVILLQQIWYIEVNVDFQV